MSRGELIRVNTVSDVCKGGATESVETKIPVDALFFVGNMDPEVSLELVSRSAKYVDRSVSSSSS